VRFVVLIDGKPPNDARGLDVDERGAGTVSDERLYQLIREPGPITERTFEITFLDASAQVYVFTFGQRESSRINAAAEQGGDPQVE
jgi:hypothetical protein